MTPAMKSRTNNGLGFECDSLCEIEDEHRCDKEDESINIEGQNDRAGNDLEKKRRLQKKKKSQKP